MAQQYSMRLFGMVPVGGPWDNFVRFAVKELTLVFAIVALCLLVGSASLRTATLLGSRNRRVRSRRLWELAYLTATERAAQMMTAMLKGSRRRSGYDP
jgi:hypothetical protein